MRENEFLNIAEGILDEVKTGILLTVDGDRPSGRWMTPAVVKSRAGAIYTFSTPDAAKVGHIQANGNVEWMIQDSALNQVINIRGIARVIENPALENELMEIVGAQLRSFWKVNIEKIELVIIETIIHEGCYFNAAKGVCEKVLFGNRS